MDIRKVKSQAIEIKCFLLLNDSVTIEQKINIINASKNRLPKMLRAIIRKNNIIYNGE